MYLILVDSFFLVTLVYLVFLIMNYSKGLDKETMSPYECGFNPNCFARLTFSYRFFLISILFIIFDVEISLMLPVPFLMESSMGLWIFLIFIGVLIVGLLYEYAFGSLDWLDNSSG